MGLLKILALISIPLAGMTYSAFSLGKQLPIASRRLGNYIGLSYVYFKCILKTLRPEDQMPYEILQTARKASQQSQALRRELRNTIKKAKEEISKKQEETFQKLGDKVQNVKKHNIKQDKQGKQLSEKKGQTSGSQLMNQILRSRQQLSDIKRLKKQSRNFYNQL